MFHSLARFVPTASILMLVLLASPATASLPSYMTVVGAQQGDIEGDVVVAGREGTFEINEVHHLSNVGSQGAEHQPLIVTTRMSKGVPSLLRALDQDESLSVTIRLYRPNNMGVEINYYTITLQNARLVIGEPIVPDSLRPELEYLPARIRLRFEFDAITHKYEVDGDTVQF